MPFSEPLWRPERVRVPDGREDRAEVLDALANLAPDGLNRFRVQSEAEEIRPGYLRELREKIAPKPVPEEPMRQLYRIVGEKR